MINKIDITTLNSKCGEFKNGSLVMIKLPTVLGYSKTWWRVIFCDNDETFIGKLERFHYFECVKYKKGDIERWNIENVQHIFKDGEQFCYSDNITICKCTGLCKDK